LKGIAEKVGLKGSFVRIEKSNGEKVRFEGEIIDHIVGIEYILASSPVKSTVVSVSFPKLMQSVTVW